MLGEAPAECVVVFGKHYSIRTDFRVWLRISALFQDEALSLAERIAEALRLCYLPGQLPPSLSGALSAMVDFYQGAFGNKEREKSSKSLPRCLDFQVDAPAIFADFWAEYGIDLSREKLHWHHFCALLSGLSPERKICRIMHYRMADLSQIGDKNRKNFYRKMKRLYAIKQGPKSDFEIGETLG